MNEKCNSNVSYPTPTKEDITNFIEAASSGYVENVKAYLEKFGSSAIDLKNNSSPTALYMAVISKQEHTVLALLDAGADIRLQDNKGYTCFEVAVCAGSAGLVRELLARGANPNHKGEAGETSLMWALRMGFGAIARQLLDAGADQMIADDSGMTALDWAEHSDKPSIRTLITNWVQEQEEKKRAAEALARATQEAKVAQRLDQLKEKKVSRSPLRK